MKVSFKSRITFFSLAIFSGVIYMLSQPKFDLYFLAPFFYIPLHVYYRKTGNIWIYFAGGFFSFFFTIHWITHAITYYGGFPYIFAIVPLSLLSAVLGFFFLIFGYVREKLYNFSKLPYSIVDPIVWVSTEYIKTFLFTGFPWALVGYTLWKKELLIQIADMGGVYIISFFVLSISGFICDVYEKLRGSFTGQNKLSNQKLVFSGFFTLLLIFFVVTYGIYRKAQIEKVVEEQSVEIVSVIVQPAIPQDQKWTPEFKERYFRQNIDLTFSALDYPYSNVLVVWPETGLTFYLEHEPKFKEELLDLAKKGFYIISGGLGFSQEGGRYKFYNRAFFINPEGEIFKYDKTHLVMFGEYIPLRGLLEKIPFIRKIIEEVEKVAGDFVPGKILNSMGEGDFRVGVPICFESIFPQISRHFVKDGASVIAVITNDAWFGYSSGPFQHFSVSAIRAVETRRFVLRSANTGISGAFFPTGKVLKQTKLLERTSFLVKIKPMHIQTFYTKYGDLFSVLCLVLSSAMYIFYLYANRRRNRNNMR